MRILLTNDDGVHAAGIQAIRAALTEFALVVTVAPAGDCSGFARKCTFSRPVRIRRLESGPHPVYECDGTPTDCVRAGLLGGLAPDADLVVSGINHGANLADDVVYSGTIGAGLEAGLLGTSAVCLSQQTPTGSMSVNYTEDPAIRKDGYDFRLAAEHGARLISAIGHHLPDEPFVLSVNYPAGAQASRSDPEPATVLTRPGRRAYPRNSMTAWDQDQDARWLYLFGAPDETIPDIGDAADTDLAALRDGFISVTPLSIAFSLDDLPPAIKSSLARLSIAVRGSRNRKQAVQ